MRNKYEIVFLLVQGALYTFAGAWTDSGAALFAGGLSLVGCVLYALVL